MTFKLAGWKSQPGPGRAFGVAGRPAGFAGRAKPAPGPTLSEMLEGGMGEGGAHSHKSGHQRKGRRRHLIWRIQHYVERARRRRMNACGESSVRGTECVVYADGGA